MQRPQRRERVIPRRVAHDGHAGRRQGLAHLQCARQRHLAQCISVADRHPALQPGRTRTRGDAQQLGQAGFARFVQVDVQAHAVALGQAEQQRQLPLGIAIQRGRVDATQHLHALGQGLLQHRGCARAGHHSRLRERHQLDLHDVCAALRSLAHGLQVPQAGAGVDIDVAAHRHGTEAAALADQRLGAVHHRRGVGHGGLFHRQALTQAGHRLVRMPAVADETLVQVDVPIHQARQQGETLQVDDLGAFSRARCAIETLETPVADVEMHRRTLAVDAAVDELQGHGGTPGKPDKGPIVRPARLIGQRNICMPRICKRDECPTGRDAFGTPGTRLNG